MVTGCNRSISSLVLLANGAMVSLARISMNASSGHRSMVPLDSSLVSSAAEDLQASRFSSFAHRAKSRGSYMFLGTWNVRSLLDAEGPIETARQGSEARDAEDRRVDLVVRELERYHVKIAALQETKWFGNAVYTVGESVVLAAGRPTPGPAQTKQRGEGVAIVLMDSALRAWRASGEQWKAWNSRLVTAKLQIGLRRRSGSTHLHVLSCYAPTFAAPREVKDTFYDELQQALNEIPSDEPYIILGDFNARVGSRTLADDEWGHVRGPHGYGEANKAGRELLAFLSLNEATVCNTWFTKRDIKKQTWKHPRSQKWHCIDLAVMRQRDRKKCVDAMVMRGAECHTDHQLLRIKMETRKIRFQRRPKQAGSRYDVGKLCGEQSTGVSQRGKFQEHVSIKLREQWPAPESSTVEAMWDAMKTTLTTAAEECLGVERRKQADWFRESSDVLEPLFKERNRLYAKWLSTGKERDHRKFAKARCDARRTARKVKNEWFQAKAAEAQRRRFSGKNAWQCIRDMQHGRRGLIPARCVTIRNEAGTPCTSIKDQQEVWRRHFTRVLNVQSQFSTAEIEKVRQRRVRIDLEDPPSLDEIMEAAMKLKPGKAGGRSGILPEMVRASCGSDNFPERLLDLVNTAWREKSVPSDWADAVLIPIPKKGDLTRCDNWRGISLLDVVGKVVAKVLQRRLQRVAEEELPESQCGFRARRGCSDMIFTVRQILEKSHEHRAKSFIVFVDLKKAYDSVPRAALWIALQKLGIPESVVMLIRSFHEGMKAQVRVSGDLSEDIDVDNGLRQGCSMAPTLFNLYACLVAERWSERVAGAEGVGIVLKYKMDGKLFRRYTRNACETKITECQFADDAGILATTREGAELAMGEFSRTADDFGLTVSFLKTKMMVAGRDVVDADVEPLQVGTEVVECVREFSYLGSIVTSSGRVDVEVEARVARASRAFGCMRRAVFRDRNLNIKTKRMIFEACVVSVLLYGSECWTPLRRHLKKLDAFHHRCIRAILGVSRRQQWEQHLSSSALRWRWGDPEPLSTRLIRRRLEWLGHVARMPDHRIPKQVLFGWLPQPRPAGGPRRRWRDVVRKDLKAVGVSEDSWHEEASESRASWRATYRLGIEDSSSVQQPHTHPPPRHLLIHCDECGREFRREGDRARHKCINERRKPISEQRGSAQCQQCRKWFRSRGGLAVHRCQSGRPRAQ